MGGLLMGTIAIFFPQIHGLAYYSTINAILEGQYLWYTIAALAFIKILATSLTLGSGGSGGIFAPCLFIGAMIGHTFGYGAHALLPHITASAGSYALVGMGALMAGVTQAPLTAVVLIFELTGKYTIILPLLVTCAISTILVQIILKGSVFTRVLAKKGIVYGERRNVLRRMKVREILRKTFVSVSPEMHYKKLLDTFTHSKQYSYPVLDSEKKLVGIISLQDFQELVLENSLADVLVVGELMTQNVITVTPNETLEEALLKIGDRNIEYLPVLESAQSKKCIGIVSRRDILSRYNQEVRELRTRAAT
jgi:CIC family chloride channel protein